MGNDLPKQTITVMLFLGLLIQLPAKAEESGIIQIKDAVRGEYITYGDDSEDVARKRAFESFERECQNWKKNTTEELQSKSLFLSLDCGEPKLIAMGSKELAGVQVESEGMISVFFKDDFFIATEAVVGEMVPEKINGKVYALGNQAKRCSKWKEQISLQLGKELLFIGCGSQRNVEPLGEPDKPLARNIGYQAQSKGVLVIRKRGSVLNKKGREIRGWSHRMPYYGSRYPRSTPQEAFGYYQKSERKYLDSCDDWKKQMTQSLGKDRILFLTCESVRRRTLDYDSAYDETGGYWDKFDVVSDLTEVWYYE